MELQVQDQLTNSQVEDLLRLYQSEWWSRGREEADVRQMLQNCDVIVALSDTASGQLVGFARVLTDFTYKAVIFDVVVETSCRSQGIGRKLLETVVNHPRLRSVRHLELFCLPEMLPFYKRSGFTSDLGNLRLMRLAK